MRLTPEFVSKSQSHLNPLKERELDLRGLAIPVIENLASHQGTYDTLNLTDNSLTVLGNIPLATRLHSIHAANNQISAIAPSLPTAIPNLASLTLTSNALSTLGALLPLADLRSLRYLSLRGNPVAEHEHYRLFMIWKVARGQLHVLDFARVTDAERAAATALFTDAETGRPNELANKLSIQTAGAVAGATAMAAKAAARGGAAAAAGAGAGAGAGGKGRLMTPDEKRRVLEALTRAETADEVRKLERMLADGLIPEGESVAAATAVVA